MKLHPETVTDGNGNDFPAFTAPSEKDKSDGIVAFVFIYGDNGFGQANGCQCITGLKRQDDGKLAA